MPCKVITEVGDEIPLEGGMVNGGPEVDAYVAEQREQLGLPAKPMDAATAVAFKIERETMLLQARQLADDLAENVTKPPLGAPTDPDLEV